MRCSSARGAVLVFAAALGAAKGRLRLAAEGNRASSSLAARCEKGSHCVVPAEESWVVDASVEVATLTVQGTLVWDVDKDGLELRAGYILVDGGSLEVGSVQRPMEKRATIYLTEGPDEHPVWGRRFLFGLGEATIQIHGRVMARTWTLLAHDAAKGDTKLQLKHSAGSMGWRVGDAIGVATTSRGRTSWYTVTALGEGKEITIDPPLVSGHMGGMRQIQVAGHPDAAAPSFELAAEVVNLQRTILITGPPNWDTPSREGLHTGIMGTGFMDVRYACVENCGQPPTKGRYCLHFHHMHHCPKCVFQGNAIVNSTQVGITVHGTHGSLVVNNILWNTASVGVYLEDGNEMNNSIQENVIICMHDVPWDAINPNKPPENCQYDLFNRPGRIGGIVAYGMTNDFVGNRVVNMENCIWTKGSDIPNGQGMAEGRVCTVNFPFGRFKGNVCHDNRRFGVYLDNQIPRMVKRDENGFLPRLPDGTTDYSSCAEVTPDGGDNGFTPANRIEDQLDYHNMFVGQYSTGDIEYVRYTGVNNAHCMYWKSSKNFVDPTAFHMRDSVCVSDASDPVFTFPVGFVLGPAGAFTFKLKNVSFIGHPGEAALSSGQHCMLGGAGGPCDVQYLLDDVDFSLVSPGGRYLNFGIHGEAPAEVLPVYISAGASLGGYQAIVSQHLDGFAREGCTKLGAEWDFGHGCRFAVRRLNIWSKDIGSLRVIGPGYYVPPNEADPILSQNAGYMRYATGYNGYGALAIVGGMYRLEATWGEDMKVDFSDPFLPATFGSSDEQIHITTPLGTCTLRASQSHGRFYGRFGPTSQADQHECAAALGGCSGPDPRSCAERADWVLRAGLPAHPELFPSLTQNSSLQEVQAVLRATGATECSRTCTPPSPVVQRVDCRTATEEDGDGCFRHVAWAMQHGIFDHPDYYPGLTPNSSFEAFQNFLHATTWPNTCREPCSPSRQLPASTKGTPRSRSPAFTWSWGVAACVALLGASGLAGLAWAVGRCMAHSAAKAPPSAAAGWLARWAAKSPSHPRMLEALADEAEPIVR